LTWTAARRAAGPLFVVMLAWPFGLYAVDLGWRGLVDGPAVD